MKLDQNMPKHIKYTTLLSKDKKLKIADKHEAPKDVSAGDKNSQISTSKYFSAPVSTKENGLVTQFKFQEKITNNKEERPRHKRSKEVKVKSKGSSGRASAESKHRRGKMSMNTSQESIFNHSKNQSQVIEQKKESQIYDKDMPKNEDIQKIFSNIGNSSSDKVIHMSVIGSAENFGVQEQEKDDRKVEEVKEEVKQEEKKETKQIDKEENKQKEKDSSEKSSNKAAVPILDFTQLPPKDKKKSKATKEKSEYLDMGSGSFASAFDQESHLDLSSKRLKKLILTSDFSSLLNLREEALKFREDREKSKINKLLHTQKISPRTGKARTLKLEKWISKEKAEITKQKKIIEEARKKTEDVLKEAHINGTFLKQIISEKVMTPREGMSVRSGLNSSRRNFEHNKAFVWDSDEEEKLQSKSYRAVNESLSGKAAKELHPQGLEDAMEKYARKEIDLTQKVEQEKSDNEILCSVETPKPGTHTEESFNDTGKVILGPNGAEGDSSATSIEPEHNKHIPVNINVELEAEHPSKGDEPKKPQKVEDLEDLASQSLSRKKSEQKLSDLHPKITVGKDTHKIKSTTTPTPQTKPNLTSPLNTEDFFTKNFDDVQEMEDAVKHAKVTSGKMFEKRTSEERDSVDVVIDAQDQEKDDLEVEPLSPDVAPISAPVVATNPDEQSPVSSSKSWKIDVSEPVEKPKKVKEVTTEDDYSLIKQVEKNKIIKNKESRNSDIKEQRNQEALRKEELGDSAKKKFYGINDDVEFLKKKNTVKPEKDDSRNVKQVQSQLQKSSKTSESNKEDIIIDTISDKGEVSEDEKDDSKNIVGSQSLDYANIETPDKPPSLQDSEFESSEKTDQNHSDSKYATVSVLSEKEKKEQLEKVEKSNKKEVDLTHDNSMEVNTANKLTDLIYSAMLAEIKAELFPPRPLFLLTADLDKIELEQAMVYLNDMSVEKEAALLKEYLKYSGGDDDDLNAWANDREDKDNEDNQMFSESGRLVLYERKGIATDLFSIEKYVDELATEVDDKCKSKFLTDTFTPLKKNSMEILNQLQNSDIGSYDHFETDLNSIAILPLEVYLELEKKRKALESEESKTIESQGDEKETALLKECEHIHNKALFDSINESLLQFKPYGKDGEPMPWSRKQRKLQKTPIQKDIDIRKMFEIIKHDMFRWSIMQAGTLPRREFIFSGVFDEELFAEIREKKLATLLATEVIENEYQWLNYDFEEAQVRVDLGDMILEHLVTEAITIADKVEENKGKDQSIYKQKLALVQPSDDEDNKDKSKNKNKETK